MARWDHGDSPGGMVRAKALLCVYTKTREKLDNECR